VEPKTSITTIVLADDHPIVRQGLRALLESQPGYSIIGEAEDGLSAVKLVEDLKPDILIVDVMMPGLNGLEVVKRVRERLPLTKIVVLSMHANEPYVLEALRSGATAYVLKATSTSNLLEAVKAAANGQWYLSPPLSDRAIANYIQKADHANPELNNYKMLTSREREVFQLTAEGLSSAEIGERLSISPRTAETHRTNIMRKLDLRSQHELVNYATQQGLISRE
jgi:two-component system, NarL family, response regulator NreC